MKQLDLFNPDQKAAETDVECLVNMIHGRGWFTAAALTYRTTWSDRKIRATASDSNGIIISGQRGYCHIADATIAEIDEAAAWLESQAKCMADRATAIRRQRHQWHNERSTGT